MSDFTQYRSSAITLLVANAVPLLGVVLLGWDAFSVVALYWFENVIIGAVNVLKMITCAPDPDEIDWSKLGSARQAAAMKETLAKSGQSVDTALLVHHGTKLFLVPFFIFHYGMFCFVHGMFVFVIFGRKDMAGGDPFHAVSNFVHVARDEHLTWAAIALAVSHLWSFAVNYIGHGEYRRTVVPILMMQPYARVIVLHVAIIFGGFVVMAIGSPMGLLVLLVIGKTVLDLKFHLREHERNAQRGKTPDEVLDESPQA